MALGSLDTILCAEMLAAMASPAQWNSLAGVATNRCPLWHTGFRFCELGAGYERYPGNEN
jgi:hypothetical protein